MIDRRKISFRSQYIAGFTLLEMAIVLCIAGLLLGTFLPLWNVYENKKRYDQTRENFVKANEALNQYLLANNSLPCPAGMNIKSEDQDFGRSLPCISPAQAQPKASVNEEDGIFSAVGRNNDMVSIGLLPFRSLGLADISARDGWGNILNYAVTENLTNPYSYAQDGGAVDVVDEHNVSRVVPAASFQYIIFSSGMNGAGAVSASGVKVMPCDPETLEGQNCDGDAVFMDTAFRLKGGKKSGRKINSSETDFDDLVFYKNFDFGLTGVNYQFLGTVCPADFAAVKLDENVSVFSEVQVLTRDYPGPETGDKILCYSPFYSTSLSLNVRPATSDKEICPEGWN